MKITAMSFNTQHCLNYIEQKIDFDVMARAINGCGADIVGLNEMRDLGTHADFAAQTEMLASLTGMKYYYFAKAIDVKDGGPYGNGFLSRIPIIKAETVLIPDPTGEKHGSHYETRCILKATLEGGITVLVTHMGLNPDEQENAVKTVIGHVEGEKCILMGDFNMTPDDPILDPIKVLMTDTAEVFEKEKLSFPSDNPRVKIDYIFVSSDIKTVSADIPAIIASDHRPHLAEIEINV